ncbi:response regulator transcription factor [Eggerthella sinensis]|uniref:DNA-binding response regulator n=1 Tax=Eggerthella sinensis TaxID=242230 RepID=A0A3N0J0T0_9ACTN|nr:response regulator transcription factor [Eggerthella sinensis]RDB69861.1 DNA-binding response regulator [Eggerthella sinensis]RNM42777.1 DNA-binding response regulator [Eggerthella sinensis]
MKLLIVEDDRLLSQALARSLADAYDIDQAFDGEEGLFYAAQDVYDLVVLDVMLPERDGFSVLEALRERDVRTPVLMLTAKGTTADKLRGLRSGADDYLTKPFDRDELLARIEAILRRSTGRPDVTTITFKDLVLHTQTKQAALAGEPLALKGKQYDILEYLVSHRGSLISKDRLFDKIWGFMSDTSSNVVEVYVSALRKALAPSGYDRYITTIRGAGYLFTEEDHD